MSWTALEAVEALSPFVRHCYLCGRRASYIGLFVPDRPWEFSSFPPAPGKVRSFFYGVCEPCFGVGVDVLAELVEAKLRRTAG